MQTRILGRAIWEPNNKKGLDDFELSPKSWTQNQLEEVQFIMSKFAKEDRLATVLEVESGESIRHVEKRLQMSPQVICRILGLYRLYGAARLSSRKKMVCRRWNKDIEIHA